MDATLIKITDEIGDEYVLKGTDLPENYTLSKKNCQAIERGYDLDELAEARFGVMKHQNEKRYCFIEGAKAILEILGDRKFTEGDMIREIHKWDGHINIHEEDKGSLREISKRVQSLQQNEWPVTIETETKTIGQCNCQCHNGGKVLHIKACCTPKRITTPKYDQEGNLILNPAKNN